ncbi:MAG: hypothetical protein ABIJ09_03645 [Pseudomonadota bacterium]
MLDMTQGIELSQEQAALFARGLFALSRVDGHEEREGMLIKSFWMDVTGEADVNGLKQLEASPDIDIKQLAAGLSSPGARELFMRTAILLAYADGSVSALERKWLETAGQAMGFEVADLTRLDELTRTTLLGQLSHLANTDAAAQVARKLGF